MTVKVKAETEAIGNGQKGNSALFPTGCSPFPTHTLNRRSYIPLLSIEKNLGGEKKKNEDKNER